LTYQRLVILIVAVAVVSIVAVVASGGPDDDDETSDLRPQTSEKITTTPTTAERKRTAEVDRSDVPDDPEKVLGNEEYALTRPANLRAGLQVLQSEAQKFEGRFDYMRIAPGRIDTTIQRSDRRKTLQLRANLKIAFSSEHEFPTSPQVLGRGLRTREVDPQMPRRILNAIDLIRPGKSAAEDLDYMVVQKSIIDGKVSWSAYLQSGRYPRQFGVEGGERRIRLRVIG
jgi:hypothetical protein